MANLNLLSRIKKKFQSFSIAAKILIVIMTVSIVPILLVELLMYTMGVPSMKKQTEELIISNLRLSANSMENLLGSYDNIIRDIYNDESYAQQLRVIGVWDNKDYYMAKNIILNKLRNTSYVNDDLLGIAIIPMNQEVIYYDTYTLSTKKSFFFDNYITFTSDLVARAQASRETVYSATRFHEEPEYGQNNCIYIAHHLIDYNDYRGGAIGYVVLCVSEQTLRNTYYQEVNMGSNISLLINYQGDIISFPIETYIGMNIYDVIGLKQENMEIPQAIKAFFEKEQIMNGTKLEINCESIRNNSFILANVQDTDYALQGVQKITYITLIVSLIIVIICMIISIFFTRSTNKKVQRIINVMQKADQGDYNMKISMEGNDEFAQIANSFNQMVTKINETMELERDSMIREKDAEIRSLEAQINPHFLYNTLDAINWVAQSSKEYKVSKMITSLAAILRYSIYKSNGIVALETELEYVKQYLFLQQRRFNFSFQCFLEVEEELLDCRVHKLLIQPLIENAIEHGFPGRTGKDEIFIQIQAESEKLVFIVQDNGCGMTKEKVTYFNQYEYKDDKEHNNIGISNVITRIKLYYGTNSEFYIESNEQGTVIRFAIPREQGGIL